MSQAIQNTLNAAGPSGVVIFSKSYCPYCTRAKRALLSIGIKPLVVELDHRRDGPAIQDALLQQTGQRSVPSVWLGRNHIGGSDDVVDGISHGLFDSLQTEGKTDKATLLKPCGDVLESPVA